MSSHTGSIAALDQRVLGLIAIRAGSILNDLAEGVQRRQLAACGHFEHRPAVTKAIVVDAAELHRPVEVPVGGQNQWRYGNAVAGGGQNGQLAACGDFENLTIRIYPIEGPTRARTKFAVGAWASRHGPMS